MPLFDYICPKCNHRFSELVKDHTAQVDCPKCQTPSKRDYNGEIVGSLGKAVKHCSGNCSKCNGCR